MLFWRGFGWAVPAIVFAALIGAQLGLDSLYGEGFYKNNEWPKMAAVGVSAVLIGILGYILNYQNRIVEVDSTTGKTIKSPSHTFFFIPIEFWAIIVPALFFWMEFTSQQQDAQDILYLESPAVNDIYSVDFTKIYTDADQTYKYGIAKVVTIHSDSVEVIMSEYAYDKKKGVREDLREAKHNSENYFLPDIEVFTLEELKELKNIDAIFSVKRN